MGILNQQFCEYLSKDKLKLNDWVKVYQETGYIVECQRNDPDMAGQINSKVKKGRYIVCIYRSSLIEERG